MDRSKWIGTRGVNVGCLCVRGWYTPQTYVSVTNECSRSQNMNCLNRSDFYSRTTKFSASQNIFDLIQIFFICESV